VCFLSLLSFTAVCTQTLQELFLRTNPVNGQLTRVPTFFYLLSLHHRTLKDVMAVQHPEQRPLPFHYVVAVVSGVADALAAAANVGVVHLDMKDDNIMVDDPEAMEFEAEQIAARHATGAADSTAVDYSQCLRRFERQPVAVVVDWGVAMQFDGPWAVVVPVVDGKLSPPDGAQLYGNIAHASPELQIESARAEAALAAAKVAVAQTYQAKTAAEQSTCHLSVQSSPPLVSCDALESRMHSLLSVSAPISLSLSLPCSLSLSLSLSFSLSLSLSLSAPNSLSLNCRRHRC
jgi:hypothetical protein